MSSSIIFIKRFTLSANSYIPMSDDMTDSLYKYCNIPTFHLNSEDTTPFKCGGGY